MRLLPDLVLVDGRFAAGRAVEIAGGRITGVLPSLLRGLGDDMDFMSWRDRVLWRLATLDQNDLLARVRDLSRDWRVA